MEEGAAGKLRGELGWQEEEETRMMSSGHDAEAARQAELVRQLELVRSDPEAAATIAATVFGTEPEREPKLELQVDVDLEQRRIILLQQKLAQVRAGDASVAQAATEKKLELAEEAVRGTLELAVEPPAETSQLVVDRDTATMQQPQHATGGQASEDSGELVASRAGSTRDDAGGRNFFDGKVWHVSSMVLPGLIGIAPFMWPMEGAVQDCAIPHDDGTALNVTCAELAKPVFVWYTCPVWLVLCAFMLLEFFKIQFTAVGFHDRAAIFVVLAVLLTYAMAELLVTNQVLDAVSMNPDYTAYEWQTVRVVGLAICAWPFMAVSVWLVYQHGDQARSIKLSVQNHNRNQNQLWRRLS